MPNGDMLKQFANYKKLSKDQQEFYTFERISAIPFIQKDVKALKAWKIKIVGFASGVSAVIGFFSSKITDLFT